ncbi:MULTISPECIES: hypothetical protein [unclassified Caballeronia]|uniref:hypothetical protein n=1 Tax=unclassified Caballeronia TaxID=2646786 RepID=UPI001FD3C3C8|nr:MULTISPECIES: hypothetical protein [unclassified Caballeronia]
MKISKQLVLCALMSGLSGAAFAQSAQTQPGASHGPASPGQVNSDMTRSGTADITTGKSATGGSYNGTSAAGRGTNQGSGGMQPRVTGSGGGSSNGGTSPSTNGGGGQGF